MIFFDSRSHIYYNTQGQVYDSPSKVFSHYKNKFDEIEASKAYANKHGKTPQYWRRKWKEVREASLERGTGIHESKEELMFGRGIEKYQGTIHTVHNSERLIINKLSDLPDGVWPEIPIWNDEYMISGKPDKLVIETLHTWDGKKRYAHIDDYKTNKSIDKISYWSPRTGEYKMMKDPLSHLMDCNWIHYALQMSFYQFIMEQAGFYVGNRVLIHIPHPIIDTHGKVLQQPDDVLYKIPYMKREILLTLDHYSTIRKPMVYKPK